MGPIPRTLPASWYTSQELYALERRAVFLRSWFFLGTITKFKHGRDVHYEIAQVQFTVRREADSKDRDEVHVKVYADATGQELQSHQTRSGLVFTSISSSAPPFVDFYPGLESLLDSHDFSQLPYRRSLNYYGEFNWKTMIDGFQECYHCQIAHPGFSKLYPTQFYRVINHQNWSRHFANPDSSDDGLFLYFFPNCTLNLYNGGVSSFRVCPGSKPGVSRMEFDYYNNLSGEPFEEYYKFVREVADEDFYLCEKAQANLEKGVYKVGCLNPDNESGVAFYQQRVFEMVMDQRTRDMDSTQF